MSAHAFGSSRTRDRLACRRGHHKLSIVHHHYLSLDPDLSVTYKIRDNAEADKRGVHPQDNQGCPNNFDLRALPRWDNPKNMVCDSMGRQDEVGHAKLLKTANSLTPPLGTMTLQSY